MVWKPNVTVAAIVERDNKFLLVEEESQNGPVINQPAGHLDPSESLVDAVIRETLEETACVFKPEAVIGTYLWHHNEKDITFLRVTFLGSVLEEIEDQPLDTGIIRTLWMSREELHAKQDRLRSPMILQSIDDYNAGVRYPLSSLKYFAD